MPKCTEERDLFGSLGRRRIEVGFDGGEVSSDAGLLLLRQVEGKLGLLKAAAQVLPDPRNPFFVVHTTEQLLRQQVFGWCQGDEDLNDHEQLCRDPALQTALDKRATDAEAACGASSPTLCRFDLHRVLVEQFIASFREPPQELILDFDATDDPVHGEQTGRHFSAYYDGYCFLPLYVFCGEQLLVAYLRSAKRDAALHAAAILKLLTRRLRQAWPDVRRCFAAIRALVAADCSPGRNANLLRRGVVDARVAEIAAPAGFVPVRVESELSPKSTIDVELRRGAVVMKAGVLPRLKALRYRRGKITVLARGGLEAASCGCYQAGR